MCAMFSSITLFVTFIALPALGCNNPSKSFPTKCGMPPLVKNGNVAANPVGSTIQFTCNMGFFVAGSNTIGCANTGKWVPKGYCEETSGKIYGDFFDACSRGFTKVVRSRLLNEGIGVNTRYEEQKHGDSLNWRASRSKPTCLMFASLEGHHETMKMLIREFNADANLETTKGETALYWAAKVGNLESVRILYEEGKADVDKGENDGYTAIASAAWYNYDKVVEYLGKRGAKRGLVKALDSAISQGNLANVRHLCESAKVDLEAKRESSWTFLMAAARYGKADIVDYLLQRGANPGAKNDEGKTAYDLASDPWFDDRTRSPTARLETVEVFKKYNITS